MTADKKKFKFDYRINAAACMACAACEWECKDNAVFVDDTVNYAINPNNCNRCGKCFRACPCGAIERIMNA